MGNLKNRVALVWNSEPLTLLMFDIKMKNYSIKLGNYLPVSVFKEGCKSSPTVKIRKLWDGKYVNNEKSTKTVAMKIVVLLKWQNIKLVLGND